MLGKRIKKGRFFAVLSVSMITILMLFPFPAFAISTTTVTQTSLGIWNIAYDNSGTSSFVTGPSTAPIGVGSFQMSTGADNSSSALGYPGGKIYLQTNAFAGTLLGSLDNLSYWTFSPNNVAPYLDIPVSINNGGVRNTTLVFDPTWQGPSHSDAVVANTWQHWNTLTGTWWCETGKKAPSICQGNIPSGLFSLSTFLGLYPNTEIVQWYAPGPYPVPGYGKPYFAGGGQLAIEAGVASGGSTWSSQLFEVDGFAIGIPASGTSVYNFEPIQSQGVPEFGMPAVFVAAISIVGITLLTKAKKPRLKTI